MHSGTLERAGSPRKRTLSRGVSEDESLREIIKEAESSSRRLTRSDSRATLKRRSDSQQSEQDLIMGLPEMMELRANYEEVLQELRGLEETREVLLFQVDVLQEALEGVEEMLAEAQREASLASLELEREREAKRKLEDMVISLREEVERLKEERNTIPAVPVYSLVREQERDEAPPDKDPVEQGVVEHVGNAPSREAEPSEGAPASITRLESVPLDTPTGRLLSLFRKPSDGSSRPLPLGHAQLGSSVDLEEEEEGAGVDGDSALTRFQRMVNKTFPSLSLGGSPSGDGVLRSPGGSLAEDMPDASPDGGKDTDSVSAYEDACADTPEQENIFPGPSDEADPPGDSGGGGGEEEEVGPADISQTTDQEPRNPNDSCIMS